MKELIQMMTKNNEMNSINFMGKFDELFDEFLSILSRETPITIKLILKIVYETVLEYYKIDEQNYNPLLTYLIFNFVISPKIQEIYNVSPSKYQFVRNLNR